MNPNELRANANRLNELADLLDLADRQRDALVERAKVLFDEIGLTVGPPVPAPPEPTVARRPYVKFSPKEKAAFKRAWKAKLPVEQIMDQFGLTKPAVYSRAMNLGLGRRFPAFTKATNGSGAHV